MIFVLVKKENDSVSRTKKGESDVIVLIKAHSQKSPVPSELWKPDLQMRLQL